MLDRLRVLVVGASIAGPSTAYWLAKAGADVTVIERFPSIRKGGQAVDIRTSGVTVMRRMPGLEELVRSHHAGEEGIGFVDKYGKSYGVIHGSANPDQQTLLSEYEILRGDLANILYDFTKDHAGIRYIFNEQINAIRQPQETEGVEVDFTSGAKSLTFDLVVAADGATSRTRAMGLGIGVRDHVYPSSIWAAYFSTKTNFLHGERIGRGLSAVNGRFMSVGPNPSGGNLVMIMGRGHSEGLRQASSRGEEKEFVASSFHDAGWISKEVIEEMMVADDFYASEIVQVRLPQYYKGRFVMVGDAGYAVGPTGFGTSAAMTGAYILAGELCKHPGDLAAGLAGYQTEMQRLVKDMQKVPPFLSSILLPTSPWMIWLRNNLFGIVAWSGIAEVLQRWLGGAFGKAEEFPIPTYECLKERYEKP